METKTITKYGYTPNFDPSPYFKEFKSSFSGRGDETYFDLELGGKMVWFRQLMMEQGANISIGYELMPSTGNIRTVRLTCVIKYSDGRTDKHINYGSAELADGCEVAGRREADAINRAEVDAKRNLFSHDFGLTFQLCQTIYPEQTKRFMDELQKQAGTKAVPVQQNVQNVQPNAQNANSGFSQNYYDAVVKTAVSSVDASVFAQLNTPISSGKYSGVPICSFISGNDYNLSEKKAWLLKRLSSFLHSQEKGMNLENERLEECAALERVFPTFPSFWNSRKGEDKFTSVVEACNNIIRKK